MQVCGNARKRPFEYTDNMSLWKKVKSNSKSKITIMEPKWHQAKEVSEIIPPHKVTKIKKVIILLWLINVILEISMKLV